MGELVSALTNLCKLLDCLVSTSLKPEYFRLSKLNKLGHEQMRLMWNVSHRLCCFSPTNKSCISDPYECIENYLRKQGGVAAYFISSDATARQLLLCFGFLLSRRIIECSIDKVLMETPLGEELPLFMVKSDSDDLGDTLARPDEADPQALLNYVLFVSGKTKHNLRAVANYSQEKAQLFSKVHKATAGALGSHLSVGDLLMTVRPELQLEFLSQCQHCIPLLQAYSKWHRKRNIFWEWMMSVIEEEFKIKPMNQSVDEITHLHAFLRSLKSEVQKAPMNEGEKSPEDSSTPVTTRRMCLGENGEVLDSVIENMNLQINNLKIDNEKIVEKLKMNLFKTGNKCGVISSILQTFCDMKKIETEVLKESGVELPLVDNLKIH